MQATIDEIFENEEILEHIEIVHSLHAFWKEDCDKNNSLPKIPKGEGGNPSWNKEENYCNQHELNSSE